MIEQQQENGLLLGRYKSEKLIQKGENYTLYQVKDVVSGERAFAKLQIQGEESRSVLREAGFLQSMQGQISFPFMIWSGKLNEKLCVLFTETLGPTLEQLMLRNPQKHFSLSTVCLIGEQLIKILENLHQKNILLQFISSQSFRVSNRKVSQIYACNLMHCNRYHLPHTKKHINEIPKEKIDFLSPFASFNRLCLFSCSRKDDLQSMFYLLVYFYTGTLPWMGLFKEGNCKSVQRVRQFLKNFKSSELTEGLPRQLQDIFKHINALEFKDRPNYSYIRYNFKKLLRKTNTVIEPQLDWIIDWEKFMKPSMTPSQLSLKNNYDREQQRLFYDKYQQKIGIDPIQGKLPNHSQNEGVDYRYETSYIRKRRQCQLI